MRSDSIGLFWQDNVRQKDGKTTRIMPPIPETGWSAPAEFPDLRAARALSIDVETYDPNLKKRGPGWARHDGHIVGIAVGTDDGGRWYFPMRHEILPETNLDPNHVLAWAADNLSNPKQPKVGANLTYDVGWLREEGVLVKGDLYDVEFAEALLDERAKVALEVLGQKYLRKSKETSILNDWCCAYYGGSMVDQRANIYRAPPCIVGPYAQGDVDLPFGVMAKQWPYLLQQGLGHIFTMECELIYLMIEMRYAGVTVDLHRAETLLERLNGEIEEHYQELEDAVGFPVNISSANSLSRAFDHLGLEYPRTKPSARAPQGNPSFKGAFLDNVAHPVGKIIRKIRKKKKITGTFIQSYILDSHINGRVYGQFHQLRGDSYGARSGRLSSSNPNLQNIPVRSELGKEMRKMFLPDYGHVRWRKYDYSQIEYRGLAHYAVGDRAEEVRALYNNDPTTDFHKMVQNLIFTMTGLLGEEDDRPLVKNVNFGTVYGMGEPGLARYLNLQLNAAKKLFAAIHSAAPFLKATMEATMEEANLLGYITTILGRRSRFDLWESANWKDRDVDDKKTRGLPYNLAILKWGNVQRAYLHKSLNRRLQGTAAEVIKVAMLRCWKDGVFDRTGVPRLTVHDELDFSDPGGVDDAFDEMEHIMETALQLRVPIRVEQEQGPTWGDGTKIKKVA